MPGLLDQDQTQQPTSLLGVAPPDDDRASALGDLYRRVTAPRPVPDIAYALDANDKPVAGGDPSRGDVVNPLWQPPNPTLRYLDPNAMNYGPLWRGAPAQRYAIPDWLPARPGGMQDSGPLGNPAKTGRITTPRRT
jgi:hypothetical protein